MRASDYPIPDYACYVWHRGDGLAFAFPDGGTLFVPLGKLVASQDSELPPGWKWLLHTLARRRANEQEKRASVIGTDARPTAQMLEQALLAHTQIATRSREIDEDIFADNAQTEETTLPRPGADSLT
jgi:hypothetical protein